MILPDFDDEEYMNRLEEDKDAADAVVPPINEVAQLTKESEKTNAKEAGEDAAHDPPPEL